MATSYNIKRLAETLRDLTFREMQAIARHINKCAEDYDGIPNENDFAEYLLGWADFTLEEAARGGEQ